MLSGHLTKEYIQTASERIKRRSTSCITKELRITMRNTPLEGPTSGAAGSTKCRCGRGASGAPIGCWRGCHGVQALGQPAWRFLGKLNMLFAMWSSISDVILLSCKSWSSMFWAQNFLSLWFSSLVKPTSQSPKSRCPHSTSWCFNYYM